MKGAYFTINRLGRASFGEEPEDHIYKLYKMKYSLASCFKDFPIPFEYTKRKECQIAFRFEEGKYTFNYKYQQYLEVVHLETRESFKLMYTSLYKVDKLKKLRNCFLLPEQTPLGLEIGNDTLKDTYIWGCELIHAIVEKGMHHSLIVLLEISEEISYL